MKLARSIVVFAAVCSVLTGLPLWAQPDSMYVLDDGSQQIGTPETTSGHVTSLGNAEQFFSDLNFGFDIAREIDLVENETGQVTGYYLLDGFGGQHEIGTVPRYNMEQKPYFHWDIARDLEVVSLYEVLTEATIMTDQVGYYVTDGYGGVHPVNNTVDLPYRRTSADPRFKVYNDFPSSFPPPYNYPYFMGFDIVRDMEVSYMFTIVTDDGQERLIGFSNGYYLLDGFGGIHNCREDEAFNPLLAPWENIPGRPYFGWDIARDMELTPNGEGYYLLDGYGGVHNVGNANLSFGVGVPSTPPYINGFDIYKDMELATDGMGTVTGYYVLDGLGIIYNLGQAPEIGQVVNVPGMFDLFRDMEVSPGFVPVTSARFADLNR